MDQVLTKVGLELVVDCLVVEIEALKEFDHRAHFCSLGVCRFEIAIRQRATGGENRQKQRADSQGPAEPWKGQEGRSHWFFEKEGLASRFMTHRLPECY